MPACPCPAAFLRSEVSACEAAVAPVPGLPARAAAAALVVPVAAALVALTGCSAANPPSPVGTSESAGSSGATAPGGGPVRFPGEDRSLSSTAADGTELAACRDGECEVVVKAGDALDLDGRHGVDRLTVASLAGDGDGDGGVRIELRGSSGSLSVQGTGVSLSSVCDGGQCRDVGALTVRPDAPARINGLRLRLGARTADGAVLVLSPR